MSVESGTVIQQIFVDSDGIEKVDDITDLWTLMEDRIEDLERRLGEVRKELEEVRGRGYTDVTFVEDQGRTYAIHTSWQMKPLSIKVEVQEPARFL